MKPATRCEQIKPFIVMDVMERIHQMEAAGIDVVHMEIGEPDFDVPECVNRATREALECHATSYTHSLGISGCGKPLRNTIKPPTALQWIRVRFW